MTLQGIVTGLKGINEAIPESCELFSRHFLSKAQSGISEWKKLIKDQENKYNCQVQFLQF